MRLGAQLYSVRTLIQTPEEYLQGLKKLKAAGYETVQHASADLDPYVMHDITQQAGLRQICPTVMKTDPLVNDVDGLIEYLRILGCDSFMLPYVTPNAFSTLESFLEKWAPLEEPLQKMLDAGITPVYHNHDFDIAPMSDWDGSFVDYLLENRPGWKFILDVCWAQYAHVDVLAYLDKLASRMECVHFKDHCGSINNSHVPVFTACGNGILPLQAYAKRVSALGIEDVLVEQDNAIAFPDPFDQMVQSAACLKRIF